MSFLDSVALFLLASGSL